MRPLITYYGGKQRMAANIVPLILPHLIYCEPFAGSAAILFAKPRPKSGASRYGEALNDLNGDLIKMYWAAKYEPQFQDIIQACPYSSYWHNWANMVLLSKKGDKLSRAVAKFISHRQGFNDEALAPWARGASGLTRAARWKKDLSGRCERLNNVALDSVGAVEFIQKWDSPSTFFYVDPPYLGTNLGGMGQWSPKNLRDLTDALNMARGSFMVSGYDDHVHRLRGTTTLEFKATCSANNASKENMKSKSRVEVVWMRGPAAPQKPDHLEIMKKQTCFTGPLLGPCPLPLAR